jgi:3-mercaptopyruvate sulfurtransferase SseA
MDEFGYAHERLRVLEGGIAAWEEAGYSLEKTAAVGSMGKRLTQWGRIKSGGWR